MRVLNDNYEDTVCVALINGEQREYYMCSSAEEKPNEDEAKFEYIGRGTIYTIDGVMQSGEQLYHFFIKTT